MKTTSILTTSAASDYALLDSGGGEKLERFGKYVLSRPDPQALWAKHLSAAEWKKAEGHFTRDEKKGEWTMHKGVPERWPISYGGLSFYIRPSSFKHTGLFPEQAANWEWLRSIIKASRIEPPTGRGLSERRDSGASSAGREEVAILDAPSLPDVIEILNLFGYTGGATLACAQAGAKVVHVDGSKVALTWARENAELSGLSEKPVRWILDDARTFVKREIKRDRRYRGIIMDPPAFGHGPDNELWKIEDHFLPLLDDCLKLLTDDPLFFLINGYSAGYSAIAYENTLQPLAKKHGGTVEIGELTIAEQGTDRLLPAGIFARWSR